MRVLGIETSCDETGVAIYDSSRGLMAQALHSQIELHAEYGGVVPELASRDHIRKTIPLIKYVLKQAKITKQDIDGIAYTAGPGLIGALLVGASIARSLAFGLNIPAIAINHMEGHLLAPMLEPKYPQFPFVALLVSGGHTLLISAYDFEHYEVLGESLDDAAGEAFDKIAKLLGLVYPGGPALAKLAEQGNLERFSFPRPMTNKPGLNFSFSGLKTSVLNTLYKFGDDDQAKADIACAFQEAVVDTLLVKSQRALQQTGFTRLIVSGGVSANQRLREVFSKWIETIKGEVFYPRLSFCTDNGAMIAYVGCQKLLTGQKDDLQIYANARPIKWISKN